ncbi:trypco2 family protein [Saccharopolyspora taberi]|uniref:Trypsin-co-occurring domain-containing protein n=1 Tax=Saccharopolyspora taberi TaxID=60895 RepID=A0ABN3VAZ1_9PSEU
MIELAELIRQLRSELNLATATAEGEPLRFELGPVELELTVSADKEHAGTGKVRFWVVEAGVDEKTKWQQAQRLKLTLQPRLAGSDQTPWISGAEAFDER